MRMGRIAVAVLFSSAILLAAQVRAQAQEPTPAAPSEPDPKLTRRSNQQPKTPPPRTVSLTVPTGTPLQVVLDREAKINKVGQPIHGRTAEPIYAFDKLVIPVGCEVTGKIIEIHPVSNAKRTLDALDAEFTPARQIDVEFDTILVPDGKNVPIQAIVTPGSGGKSGS